MDTVSEAEAAFSQGNALFSTGRVDEAIAAYRRSIALDGDVGASHFNLGVALRRTGDAQEATLAFLRATRLNPRDFNSMKSLVATVAERVRAGQAPSIENPDPPTFADSPRDPVSIVVCSIDASKLAAMQLNYGRALAGREHEFVVIRDARSLAEGYNRALARCRFDTVVFSHDDVELLSPHPFDRLLHALRSCDIAGLAGSRRVTGPAVMWAGHPHLHGWIGYPAPEGQSGWDATLFSLEAGLVGGMQALDGVFFAAGREVAARIGFDAETFDSFHFYDLDFTYRAHLAGLRIAVTTDVVAIHQSAGDFGEAWQRSAARFQAKFPGLRAAAADHHAYAARFEDRDSLLRFYGAIRALAGIE